MPYYESVFIARQDISEPQVEALTGAFVKTIEDTGGKVAKQEYWGLKNLAYRIKKNRKGHYVLFNIDGPSDSIEEMERQMRLHEDILRHLTIRVDELEEGPSAMMQRGSARDDRNRRDFDGRGPRHGRGPANERNANARPTDDKQAVARPSEDKPAEAPPTDDKQGEKEGGQ